MNRFFQAASLVLLLSAPTVVGAQTPSRAWQQTWQLARQHFPALQVTEFDLTDSSWMVCQAGTPQEQQAFANSKYSFRDAEILASFWNQGLDDSKARIGRKVLFGNASIDLLDQELRAGRTQALASVNQLRFFRESYSFRDAEALARFWGEPGPFEAKLRMERKIITGDEATVQADLQRAASASTPITPPPPNPASNQAGRMEKFYDTQHNFGLDIPAGWQRQAPTPHFTLRLNNNGSTFEVASGPAQDPQAAVNAARNHLVQLGAQIQNQFPTQLAGMTATRLDYSMPGRGRFGQMIICVTGRNQSFVVGAESNNLNGSPIGNDVKTMYQSFLINAR